MLFFFCLWQCFSFAHKLTPPPTGVSIPCSSSLLLQTSPGILRPQNLSLTRSSCAYRHRQRSTDLLPFGPVTASDTSGFIGSLMIYSSKKSSLFPLRLCDHRNPPPVLHVSSVDQTGRPPSFSVFFSYRFLDNAVDSSSPTEDTYESLSSTTDIK